MRIINRSPIQYALTHILRANFCKNKYPYNINQQQHATYLKRVERAEQDLEKLRLINPIPRRKRRVYDKPKHDLDISNYAAWRIYDPAQMLNKIWAHGAPVAAKLQIQPKWLIHAFGMGLPPMNHYMSANLEFSFEDNNFSKFLLYEYRNTTEYQANQEGYNYADQSNVPQKKRKIFRLSPEQFWKSQEYFQFRLNCSAYGQRLKFKKWILQTVEARKSKESYDEFINKKFGPVLTYNKKQDAKNYEPLKPMLLAVGPQHYAIPKKGQKIMQAKVDLPKAIDEAHRIVRKKSIAQVEEKKVAEGKV